MPRPTPDRGDRHRPLLDEERAAPSRASRRVRRNRAIVAGAAVLALVGGAAWWARDKVLTPWSESCSATALGETVTFERLHVDRYLRHIPSRFALCACFQGIYIYALAQLIIYCTAWTITLT